MSLGEARRGALDVVLKDLERQYGKGSVVRLGEQPQAFVETFSTGALTLDLALGGGLPRGRIVEVYGPESSGKTTLALQAVAEVQAGGGSPPSSTPSTRSTRTTRAPRGWRWTTSWCASPSTGRWPWR